jgi:hypothetical protein
MYPNLIRLLLNTPLVPLSSTMNILIGSGSGMKIVHILDESSRIRKNVNTGI